MAFSTRGAHLWVMFGPLLIPIIAFLIYLWSRPEKTHSLSTGLKLALGLYVGLSLLMFAYAALISVISYQGAGEVFLNNLGVFGQGFSFLMSQTLLRRFVDVPGGWITLVALLIVLFGLLGAKNLVRPFKEEGSEESAPGFLAKEAGYGFILLVILIGVLLILEPEFFYLRDGFGSRMNTIFKFYFQAWILWGLVASYASVELLSRLKGLKSALFTITLALVVIAGLAYPVVMLGNKTNNFKPVAFTLDGNDYLARNTADDYTAIQWLSQQPLGVVSEAIGGSYSEYARVSTRSGMPTVLGWPGHEGQWRNGYAEVGSREADIKTIYTSNDWNLVLSLIKKYNIRYVYVGYLENSLYKTDGSLFKANLPLVYQNNSASIFEVPGSSGEVVP
jgi:hypothetical protein